MRRLNLRVLLCGAAMLIAAGSTVADEKDDWLIGRVFMSRADRVMLDNLRNSPQATTTVSSGTNVNVTKSAPEKTKSNPTGYILSSDGSPYRWENGHFRKTSRASIDISVGGEKIEIVKHQQSTATDSAGNADNKETKKSAKCGADRPSDHDSEC